MSVSALEYHRKTCYDRRAMGGRGLDWANQPDVFKRYPGLDTVSLPVPGGQPRHHLGALLQSRPRSDHTEEITLVRLSEIIQLTHSVTAKARHGSTDFYYRNVASAGALYPFELYVGVQGVTGIRDGLYHHTLGLGGLTPLRVGKIMPSLMDFLQEGDTGLALPTFFLTSIFFRSSWKYGERAYRYILLDTGHLAENLFLALKAHGLALQFHYDFMDESANEFLAVDVCREGCLAVACVNRTGGGPVHETTRPEKTAANLADASQVSVSETHGGLIRQIHDASCALAARPSEYSEMHGHLGLVLDRPLDISASPGWSRTMDYPDAVFSRRSRRNFVPSPVSAADFGRLLKLVCAPCDDVDGGRLPDADAVSVGFLAGRVEGVKPGFFLLARKAEVMFPVSQGFLMDRMAHICLGQAWLAHSAVHFVFLSNLERLEAIWGARGYRYAGLTAGRLGQRIYIGATALGLGCCGIGAFYDTEAAGLLGVNDATHMLYLVAVGPVKRSHGSR